MRRTVFFCQQEVRNAVEAASNAMQLIVINFFISTFYISYRLIRKHISMMTLTHHDFLRLNSFCVPNTKTNVSTRKITDKALMTAGVPRRMALWI